MVCVFISHISGPLTGDWSNFLTVFCFTVDHEMTAKLAFGWIPNITSKHHHIVILLVTVIVSVDNQVLSLMTGLLKIIKWLYCFVLLHLLNHVQFV